MFTVGSRNAVGAAGGGGSARHVKFAAGASLVVTVLAGCGTSSSPSSQGAKGGGTIVIGATNDLSGVYAGSGVGLAGGLKAAISAVNAAGGIGGKQLKLVSLDDAGATDRAIANITQLKTQYKAAAVTGYTLSSQCIATQKDLEAANIAQVCSSGNLTLYGGTPAKNSFLTAPIAAHLGEPMIQAVANLVHVPHPRISTIAIATPSTLSNMTAASEAAKKKGWTVAASVEIPPTATTVESAVSKVVASKPDAIVSNMGDTLMIQVIRGVRAAGLNVPIITGPGTTSVTPLTTKDKNVYMTSAYAQSGPARDAFETAVKAAGGDPTVGTAVYGYVQGLTIIAALKACDGCSGTDLIKSFEQLKLDTNGLTATPIEFGPADHVGIEGVYLYNYSDNGLAQVGEPLPASA